jgi:hypothetical protein
MVKFPDCYFGRNTSILAEFPGEEQSRSSHNAVFPGCLARCLNVWFGLPAFSARIIPIRASATPRWGRGPFDDSPKALVAAMRGTCLLVDSGPVLGAGFLKHLSEEQSAWRRR